MVSTRKFSQFVRGGPITRGDEPVGVRSGVNEIWDYTNIGADSWIVEQPTAGLKASDWMRVELPSGIYVKGQADTAENAEIVGVIVEIIDANHFIIQQVGRIDSSMAVFSGLVAGTVYFLSPDVPGLMVDTDVAAFGLVSKPLFMADSPSSGNVADYRGLIVGDEVNVVCPCTYTGIHTVFQASHGFGPGDAVRLSGSITYIKAQSNNKTNSQSVGIVANVINTNTFELQTEGYNSGAISSDDMGASLVPGTVYYLSPTVAGKLTSTNPMTSGNYSKPMYVAEQVYSGAGINTGFIVGQRTLNSTNAPIFQQAFPMALLFGR